MWAYVDETGNTGNHILDPGQPYFITAALMTRTNFDLVRFKSMSEITTKIGVSALHANELGLGRIDAIALDLLRVIKGVDARFFVSRLEKRYLVTTKIIDTYFDQGENLAVPWHMYWLRPMRLMLTFKIAHFVLTEEIAQLVWNCLTASSDRKSRAFFISGAEAMLLRVANLPDARSCQVVTDALRWAVENPENFTTHLKSKSHRYQHSPNFVAFTNLLDGINGTSKKWRQPIREIVHDRQSQFEKTLSEWHRVVSRPDLAAAKPLRWPGETEPLTVARVTGSEFRIASEETSPGLQVIDVLIWLMKRVFDGKAIGQDSATLLDWVMRHAFRHDFSFAGVGEQVSDTFRRMMSAEQSEEQRIGGAKMLVKHEADRREAMAKYAREKSAREPSVQ